MHRQTEIRESLWLGCDDEDAGGHPLQDIHLPYDDGSATDADPALVQAAESPGPTSGEDGGRHRRLGHDGIMTEGHVGRLVAACLHQAILDVLPQRIDYYEEWLRPDGLRDGRIGLGPITAVIGFLRTEGEAYNRVMERAGALAADWTVDSMTSFGRRMVGGLPGWLRTRTAARVAARIVRSVLSTSAASARVRRGQVRFDVKDSLFCTVRDRQALPLCMFYSAAAQRTLDRFGIRARARIDRCRAVSGTSCLILLDLSPAATVVDPAKAA